MTAVWYWILQVRSVSLTMSLRFLLYLLETQDMWKCIIVNIGNLSWQLHFPPDEFLIHIKYVIGTNSFPTTTVYQDSLVGEAKELCAFRSCHYRVAW